MIRLNYSELNNLYIVADREVDKAQRMVDRFSSPSPVLKPFAIARQEFDLIRAKLSNARTKGRSSDELTVADLETAYGLTRYTEDRTGSLKFWHELGGKIINMITERES